MIDKVLLKTYKQLKAISKHYILTLNELVFERNSDHILQIIIVQIFMVLHELQQIELSNNPNFNYLILEIANRYRITFLLSTNSSSVFYVMATIIITFSVCINILTISYMKKLIQSNSVTYYLMFINHYLLFIPIFYAAFQNLSLQSINEVSIICMILSLTIEVLNISFNTKLYFIETEGAYFSTLIHFIIMFFNISFCLIKAIIPQSILIIQIIQIILKIIYCSIIIEKQDHNTTFQLSIQIIIIIQILLNTFKLDWCQMMIYFILGITLITAIRQKIILSYILDNNQLSLLKFQIHNLVQSNKKKKIIEILIASQIKQANLNIFQIINNFDNFDQKIQYIDYLKNKNCMQGLLLLSKIKSEQFSYLQKIKLQTIKKIFNSHCNRYYNQQEDIKVATKVLIVEDKVIMILNKISKIKIDFLLQLKSDQEEQAYINSILKSLNKTTQELQNYKNQFENLIDLNQQKMKFLSKSDILTIKHIANFYQNFYFDSEKASQIRSRMIDKIQWNKILNLQIEACQCFVIQISYQREFGKIYKLNTQRLKQTFPNLKIIPQNMLDILPLFWKDSYFKLIKSYLESSQNSKNIIIGVLKNEQFIQPCQFNLSYQLTDDDIIINQFIIIEKLTPQTLWFNSDGQILGISKEIYEHLILKSENAYTQQLKINEFLENSMIQFYINDIYSQVLQFQNLTLQNQFTLKTQTQWKFPLNHKKCFERVKQFYQEEIQLTSRKSLQQLFYSQSTKNMFNNFKSKVTIAQATDPKIQNIPIKMIKPNYQEQISKLVISSKSISIDIEYELNFQKYEQIQGDQIVLFSINFLGVEGLKSHISQDQYIQQGLNNLINNIQQCDQQNNLERTQTYVQGENLINHKRSYKHIKISLFLLLIVSIILIVLSYFNISTNQKDIQVFEYYYDYAIYPQAITFVYAALYLNQWNRLCQINNIYNLSDFVENSRLGSLEFVNGIFLVRYNQDAMGSYLLSLDINQEKIIVDFYINNTLEKDEMDYLQFFDIARTKMDKMHRENLINYKTPLEDYSTLNSSNFIRQNVIKIFVFCDIAMEALVQIVLNKIEQSTLQFNIILIVECSLACIIILIQSTTMIWSSEIKNNIFQLLSHLSHDTINDMIIQLGGIHSYHTMTSTTQNQSTTNNQQQNRLIKSKSNAQINHKLTNHKYKSLKSFILPLTYFVIFITLSLSVSFLHLEYYSQYKQSLRTTFQFVKLKKIFDSSVLLGELIKTEYLINSDSLKYINQTEIISQFFNYTDQLLPIINDIIDEVMENDIFNTSTQNIIMTALQGNLCENFPKFYYFCNISSDLTYSEKDITYMYLTQGISGMMQKYQNLLQSEFSYERDSLQYETDITLLQEYLDSQTHQNIFVQYFYDMEYLVYTSFNYFYEQTMTIGQEVKDKLSNFFLYSGLISLAIISVEFLIWYYIEDQEFSQLKLIITLLPQSLLKNKNINRLVVRTFTQIY
ncbi:unnamed protein product [Paramecium sonneborni]|uniref:Transmembrane protein n=1 Tax=Paramecium sonneborni TaxID=65129 RepID=A0A8S1R5D9_9CILI|nr:unnamed protein product [Paramecium sonneborni]